VVRNILNQWSPTQWYSELVVDRIIFDQLQKMIDPDWSQSFNRLDQKQRKDYRSGYWWRPGKWQPDRMPNTGHY